MPARSARNVALPRSSSSAGKARRAVSRNGRFERLQQPLAVGMAERNSRTPADIQFDTTAVKKRM